MRCFFYSVQRIGKRFPHFENCITQNGVLRQGKFPILRKDPPCLIHGLAQKCVIAAFRRDRKHGVSVLPHGTAGSYKFARASQGQILLRDGKSVV